MPRAYVELAHKSLLGLCRLAEDAAPEALEEAAALWGLLAWADGRIDPHERAVFASITAEARAMGAPEPLPLPSDGLDGRPVRGFLRRAAARDDRRAGRMANELEAFGFGLLAADLEIREEEHAALRRYIGELRRRLCVARDAGRALLAAA